MNDPHNLVLLLAVGLALVLAGCGDDDDDETTQATTTATGAEVIETTGTAATKEEWIATADELCASSEQEVNRAAKQQGLSSSSSSEEIATFTETVVIPIQRALVESLRGLTPPEGEEEAVNEILDAVDAGLDEVEGDPNLLRDPQAADAALDAASRLAQDYGLTECGSDD